MDRPDLSTVDDEIVAYIEYLEGEILSLQSVKSSKREERASAELEPSEPETTVNVIVFSRNGLIKRTPRHFYGRQRRSGRGNFDMEFAEGDGPQQVVLADLEEELIVITNFARIFHLPTKNIPEGELRDRGVEIAGLLKMHGNETVVKLLVNGQGERIASLTPRGYVFTSNRPSARDGDFLYNTSNQGGPVDCCWTSGDDNIFIATKQGKGIRFDERQVPKGGCLGIRLDPGDELLGLTAVTDDSGVFMLSHDGKGTIRLMEGFRQNRAPGAGGKVAIKSDKLVAAVTVEDEGAGSDIFAISETGKMIRFSAAEVPSKTGVVQGVNCMGLRNDEVSAVGLATL